MRVACKQCGTAFDAELWVIVDLAERPDLAERLRVGTLYTFACPACAMPRRMGASLLVYQPQGQPPLVFSPIKGTAPDHQWQEAGKLAGKLRAQLGEGWRDEWLTDGLTIMSNEELGSALATGPGVATRNAGLARHEQYKRTRAPADLDEAIALFEASLAALPEHWLARADVLGNLGLALRDRFHRAGNVADLQLAIGHHEQVLKDTRHDHAKRAQRLTYAGLALRDRYNRSGDGDDLSAAIERLEEAAGLVPEGAPDRAGYLNRLGNVMSLRFHRAGDARDLDRAIELWHAGLEVVPAASSDRRTIRQNLAAGLHSRYARDGRAADLEQAIAIATQLLQELPAGSPGRIDLLTNLGHGLRGRYRRGGAADDLEQAMACHREVLRSVAETSSTYAANANDLAGTHSDRHARSGDLDDLEQALQLYRRAVAATPATAPQRPVYLANLGNTLHVRHRLTAARADLDEALPVLAEAVELTPQAAPQRASRLNKLAGALVSRYALTPDGDDLEKAIALYREAQRCAAPQSTDRLDLLNNCASALRHRYKHAGHRRDLDEAIGLWQEAVAGSAAHSPDRAGTLNNLGLGSLDRFAASSDNQDLEQATAAFRAACELGLIAGPEAALASSQSWGQSALQRGDWKEACAAFAFGLRAIDQLVGAQLLRAGKEAWLRTAQRLHRHAAFALARSGDAQAAVAALEAGRARLLADALERDRADLEQLAARGHGDLYERYRSAIAAVARLETTELAASIPGAPAGAAPDGPAEGQSLARAALGDAIAAIRALDGYEDFFAAPSFAAIAAAFAPSAAGEERAAVYLNVTAFGAVALVVLAGRAVPVWLDVTEAGLQDLLMQRENDLLVGGYLLGQLGGGQLPKILATLLDELGRRIALPVALALQELAAARGTAPPSLVLIPTGLLALCPLHAARFRVGTAVATLLDRFVVSYAPSARAFRHSRERLARFAEAPPRLFGVGNPLPLPAGMLPLQFARTEIDEIAPLFDGRAEALVESDATRAAVEARLATAAYLHFACHGRFDPAAPLESGLVLAAGELLRLADLIAHPVLAGARLATLSACQTAISDFQRLPEEALGLPSGFLQVGLPGVIGTLWPVTDLSTALLMMKLYQYHLRGEGERGPMPPAVALQQAQLWLRSVTSEELAHLFRDKREAAADRPRMAHQLAQEKFRQYTLRRPEDRPFDDPYYWAAFVYYGA